MSSIKDNVNELNQMILEGKILEAFDRFYDDSVVMQDNENPAREGKQACRTYEEQFVNSLTAFRGAEVKNIMVSEEAGVAAIEWFMDYSHKDWGDVALNQVSIQKWNNGKIVSEKFFYN